MHLDVETQLRSPVPDSLLDSATTVTGALAEMAERFPEYAAVRFLDRRHREEPLTLAALWERARMLQARFVEHGLRPGDTVVLALPTSPELIAAYFGAMLAGGRPGLVSTPFHRYADHGVYAAHLAPILDLAQPRLVYGEAEVAEVCGGGGFALPATTTVLTPAPPGPGPAPDPVDAQPDDIAMVQYSSGSTGAPKGVLLSHRCLLNNMRATRAGLHLSARDVSVNWVPLYHDMGLVDGFLRPLLGGSPVVLIPTGEFLREPELWLWAIHHYGGTIALAPNFAYTLCARRIADADLAGLDLSSWRVAVNASEPALARTVEEFEQRFAPLGLRPETMTVAWGLAEAVCLATAHPVGETPLIETIDRAAVAARNRAEPTSGAGVRAVSIGKSLPGCELEVRDDDGAPLPDRRIGTLWVRNTSLFRGYLRDRPPTAAALVDGWLNTGDEGYAAGGYYFFIARRKDLIVIGGEKYAPQDVEGAIDRVPGVRAGCSIAFGVLNEERGTEDIAAVVETRVSDPAERDALCASIRAEVTRRTGLAVRHVLLVEAGGIEKTTSGKLARGATRRRYLDRIAQLV